MKDPHVTGAIRHDWDAIKMDYITEPTMSMRKVAEKHGARPQTVMSRARKEGWYEEKKAHQARVVKKAVAKAADRQASKLAREADYLSLMQDHLGRMLSDGQQFNRHLVQTSSVDKDGMLTTTEERIFDKFDSKALRDAMQTLKMIEDMTRSLNNLQRIETLQKNQIERERLALEREKFEFEKEKANYYRPDKTNAIRIDGLKEEWTE